MGPTSAIILALCIGAALSFPPDVLIGIRSAGAPKERFERQPQPLIGIRAKDEIGASTEDLVGFTSHHRRFSKELQSYEEMPLSRRRSAQAHGFCADNMAYFNSNCLGMFTDRDENVKQALFRFCPWFENKCLHRQ
ncbi:unnamed protein product [Heligmosomoides polygyrus]|uniref:BPTI/Kunitz inhibitor domain-containing protein n=1 Tax=Heligmosomoides polygyrus TaxID=6339 RepID=A0A183FHB5_HELPZ|nr:unnamed protein product [Heligmosomoides polygyrus]